MKRTLKKANNLLILLATCFLISSNVKAQDTIRNEVKTLDGIIEALYGSISGEKGVERDWDLFHALFTENAQLIHTRRNEEGVVGFRSMTPNEYSENAASRLMENGFFENEIYRVKEQYGPVVHIFSTYESRNSAAEKDPFARGINSIQLLNDGNRWWIMNIYWSAETEENPLPDKYLPH